jgi:hypothetical protein
MRHDTNGICSHLRGVYDYELAHGNAVARVETRPIYGFSYVVVFERDLTIWGNPATGDIPQPVRYWDAGEPRPPSISTEAGFQCPEHD